MKTLQKLGFSFITEKQPSSPPSKMGLESSSICGGG